MAVATLTKTTTASPVQAYHVGPYARSTAPGLRLTYLVKTTPRLRIGK